MPIGESEIKPANPRVLQGFNEKQKQTRGASLVVC